MSNNVIVTGPRVPAFQKTASWRTVLVEEPEEFVVYAEYFFDGGSYYSHGNYFPKDMDDALKLSLKYFEEACHRDRIEIKRIKELLQWLPHSNFN